MTGNRSSADDQVQEAFLSAWRGIGKFRRGSPFKPWVVRILVNGIVSQRRRRAVSTQPLGDLDRMDDSPDVVESVEAKRRRELVRQAIGGLAPEHREVIVLRYFADMTVAAGGLVDGYQRGDRQVAASPGAGAPAGGAGAVGEGGGVMAHDDSFRPGNGADCFEDHFCR